jgi:hypothetical protein
VRQVLRQAERVLRLDDVGALVDLLQQRRLLGVATVISRVGAGAAGDRLAALLGAQRLLQPLALPGLALALEPALAG